MTRSSSKNSSPNGLSLGGTEPLPSRKEDIDSQSDGDGSEYQGHVQDIKRGESVPLSIENQRVNHIDDTDYFSDGSETQETHPTLSSNIPENIEGHDAWAINHLSRRNTLPPMQKRRSTDVFYRSQPSSTPVSKKVFSSIPVRQEEREGGALDLVDRSRSSQVSFDLWEEMEELYALGEFTGALRIAELILGSQPDNEQAQLCATNSRIRLESKYKSKIGPLCQIPVIEINDTEIRWLGLDHRAGFVLSRIDCKSSVEELLDICGMPHLEVLKTIIELFNRGAIRFEGSK